MTEKRTFREAVERANDWPSCMVRKIFRAMLTTRTNAPTVTDLMGMNDEQRIEG